MSGAQNSRDQRAQIIKRIEEKTNSKLLVYLTGDRRNLEAKISGDVINLIQDILLNSKKRNGTISLMIYSLGGDGVTALSLVSLIREYCATFKVIIPFKAFSAATLISLGANSIIMLKSGEMGPVDVNITTPFNPSLGSPERPEFLPINVEDLYGFVNFSKKQVGLTQETNLVEILNTLSEKINPLAIGAVHRAREKNKKIASTLLGYHMKENEIIEEISEIITTGLFEHSFVISRKDAKNLKLPIESIDDDMEKDIWTLFKCYADIMQLSIPYNPESLLNSSDEEEATFHRALLEHLEDDKLDTYTYSTKRKIFRKDIPDPVLKIPLPQILERDIDSCWHINNDV